MDGSDTGPAAVRRREVAEWALRSDRPYENPFLDVAVDAEFEGPAGRTVRVPGFHDGDGTWRVRFSAGEEGAWTYRIRSRPHDPALTATGSLEVRPGPGRGFLRATPGDAWGFRYESGEPVFLLGDTVYNLFAETMLGNDVRPFLQRRVEQGFNVLRVSVPVMPYHPPNAYTHWYGHRLSPWGGSDSWPAFDRFDTGYFRAVDETVRLAGEVGIGLELIMQMHGAAFPWRSRELFTAEWEELWTRYLVARYDAFPVVYIWTLANEYEYYPNGDWHHGHVADRWAIRVGRQVKALGGHGHVVAVHNGPTQPPFGWRFRADPQAVDAVMYQCWGTRGEHDGWLAAGIEDSIAESLAGWPGSAVFAEYGYEHNPGWGLLVPGHRYCDVDHTRRGAWRGAFSGLGVIHGFDNQWWGFGDYAVDQDGVQALMHLRRFLTEIAPFDRLRPDAGVVLSGPAQPGRRALALASGDRDVVAVYLPAGGTLTCDRAASDVRSARWFDPRTGELTPAELTVAAGDRVAATSPGAGTGDRPDDWTLLLER